MLEILFSFAEKFIPKTFINSIVTFFLPVKEVLKLISYPSTISIKWQPNIHPPLLVFEEKPAKQINYDWIFVFENIDKESISELKIEFKLNVKMEEFDIKLRDSHIFGDEKYSIDSKKITLDKSFKPQDNITNNSTYYMEIGNTAIIYKKLIKSSESVELKLPIEIIHTMLLELLLVSDTSKLEFLDYSDVDKALNKPPFFELPMISLEISGHLFDGRRIKQRIDILGSCFLSEHQFLIDFFKNFNERKVIQKVSTKVEH